MHFKLNLDLSSGVSDLNIEGFVSKQRGSLHRLFAAEIRRAPLTLIASQLNSNPASAAEAKKKNLREIKSTAK